ncbi:kelch-like protein 10 [Haemaphysalis longicornis]
MNANIPTSLAALQASDGGSFAASKDSLGACSRYFDVLCNGPMSKPGRGYFDIPGVSTESLQAIVTYCSGHALITVHNVQDLTVAAEQFMVDSLRDECCAFISHNIDVDNCVMGLELAKFYYLDSLKKSALRFLLDNTELVYKDNCDFPRLSLTDLADLLRSDELKVRREESVWEAPVLWIKANYKERRAPADILFVYGGVCRIGPMSNVWETYNHKTSEWKTVRTAFVEQTMFGPHQHPLGLSELYTSWGPTSIRGPFDAVAKVWSTIQPMHQPMALFGTAVICNSIYCIGGSPDGRGS